MELQYSNVRNEIAHSFEELLDTLLWIIKEILRKFSCEKYSIITDNLLSSHFLKKCTKTCLSIRDIIVVIVVIIIIIIIIIITGIIIIIIIIIINCHRGFLRPQWQICQFPQFTANFIIFHEKSYFSPFL